MIISGITRDVYAILAAILIYNLMIYLPNVNADINVKKKLKMALDFEIKQTGSKHRYVF